MKIFVCVKQVPDTETKIKISGDNKSIDTSSIKWILNPYDEYAVEEALKLRDSNPGSQVYVVSLGPKKRVVETVRVALAMGADEGIVIDAPENIDPLSTAKALSSVIKQEGLGKIVLVGKIAIDDNASLVGPMLAELLDIPHITVVSKITPSGDDFTVERDIEGGAKEIIISTGATLFAANKGLNTPRYASLPGIMKAKKKIIKEVDFQSLGINQSSKLEIVKIELPAEKSAAQILGGDPAEQTLTLVKKLREEAKVI